ncbi:hypothetical protein CRG98_030918 [Punica granatum]|uniref:Uncharacterized protein n=1 Tax=Punica granatum TaxID=22663 RepID=A0A2I0IXG0_PUNGR|nr:hypothetical protein CRG98_030918 [Punica granatum]
MNQEVDRGQVMLGREYIPGGSRGRMDHEREVPGFEYGRATKHSASHVVKAEEAELSEMFHKVLLVVAPCSTECCQSTDAGQSKDSRPDPQVRGSNGGREQGSRQRNKSSVDLRTLLILEARMVGRSTLHAEREHILVLANRHSAPRGLTNIGDSTFVGFAGTWLAVSIIFPSQLMISTLEAIGRTFPNSNCCPNGFEPSNEPVQGPCFDSLRESVHSTTKDDGLAYVPVHKPDAYGRVHGGNSVGSPPEDSALQNTGKSLYDAIGEKYPDFSNRTQHLDASPFIELPNSNFSGSSCTQDDAVGLISLMMLGAQPVSSNDVKTANELLKQIRENSSPSGDGCQRLAHYFANGLDARMVGNHSGTRTYYLSFPCKRRSAADICELTIFIS